MDFTISSSLLAKHMQNAMPFRLGGKPLNPILGCFLFEVKDGWLEIMATNLEVTLLTRLPVDEVEREGAVVLPPENLLDALRRMGDTPVHITVDEDHQVQVQHSSGNQQGQMSFPGMPPEDFAELPQLDADLATLNFRLSARDLKDGIDQVLFAASRERREVMYHGVLMEMAPDSLHFVATDSLRIASFLRRDISCPVEQDIFIPLQPATLLLKVLEGLEDVELSVDGRYFKLTGNNLVFVSQLTAVEFPNYRNVIPGEGVLTHSFTVDADLMGRSLDLVLPFASKDQNAVALTLKPGELTLTSADRMKNEEAYQRLPFTYEGPEYTFRYPAGNLKDALNVIQAPEIVIQFKPDDMRTMITPSVNRSESEEFFVLTTILVDKYY